MTKDLTSGNPFRLILGFSIPVWLGFLFQQFYTVVDTVIVGRILGVDALAAVGCTGSVNFLLIGFCMGLCGGFAIPVAQRFGARDYSTMRRFISNIIYLSILFSVLMTVFTVLLSKRILIWMHTPSNIIDMANSYILVLYLGIPFTILYNIGSGILRALGDSKTPLYFLILAALLNIVLDLVFILVFHLSVSGAALATVISQGVSGVLCVFYMVKHFPIIRLAKEEKGYNSHCTRVLLANGIPFGLQYSITAIGSIILQSSVNGLGSGAVAAVTAGVKVNCFFCTTFDAMGTTMASYAGQNVGAGAFDRVKKGIWCCTIISAVYSVMALLVLYFFGANLATLIVGRNNPEVVADAHYYLVITALFYLTLAWVNIVRFGIQGMGYGRLAIFSGVFEMIARTVVALLVPVWGFAAVCAAGPVAWILADLFLFPAFYWSVKNTKRNFELHHAQNA
jgi:putative efflux protein, MATE family